MTKILVFQAKKIITMNASNPYATHVAIQDGRILGAGTLDEMAMYGAYDLNDSFADKILTPGFVEGHAHAMEGGVWDYHMSDIWTDMTLRVIAWKALSAWLMLLIF